MLSILSRMNPAICLGGGSTVYDDVRDDVVVANNTPNDSLKAPQEEGSNNGSTKQHDNIVLNDNRQSSFSCLGGPNCSSKYQPDDQAEPLILPSDVALQSLNRTVPDLLDCISKSPPTILPKNIASQQATRKLMREYNTKRTSSLEKLYELTKKGKEHNRVPLVCNTEQWDVIGVLTNALLISSEDKSDNTTNRQSNKGGKLSLDEDRRLILWTLNNLSVPYENKGVIALGEHSSKLLHGLTMIMQSNQPESYLCCICLLNLTFHADAIRPVTFYVPSSYGNGKPPYSPTKRSRSVTSSKQHNNSNSPLAMLRSIKIKGRSVNRTNLWSEGCEARISEICSQVLGNSSSLIRVIERMLMTNAPFLLSKVQSAQGEAVRWGCGFIRNVTYVGESSTSEDEGKGNDSLSGSTGRQGHISNECIEEICLLISQTEIPRLMVQFVKDSSQPTVKWTKDSLEDICLGIMCNIAQWQPSQEALRRAGALQYLQNIESLPGIHGYRARAIRCSLGALPKHFG